MTTKFNLATVVALAMVIAAPAACLARPVTQKNAHTAHHVRMFNVPSDAYGSAVINSHRPDHNNNLNSDILLRW
jgi:hypothetical protein